MPAAAIALASANVTVNSITFAEGLSTGGYGAETPNLPSAVQIDQELEVTFDWTQSGVLFSGFSADKWELEVLFEQMGNLEAPSIPIVTKAYTTGDPVNYNERVKILPGTMPSGVFRMVSRLALKDLGGRYPVVAFEDHGLIQYYSA